MKNSSILYLKRIAQGIFVSLLIVAVFFVYNRDVIVGQMLLYETMPNYKINDIKTLLSLAPKSEKALPVFSLSDALQKSEGTDIITELELDDTSLDGLIRLSDDIYEYNEDYGVAHTYSEIITSADLDKLTELNDLRKFYIVDEQTDLTAMDFNVNEFMNTNLSIDTNTEGPKVLVFHTHSTELFADSVNENEGVLGLGDKLCEILEKKYGIKTLHDRSRYDIIDGKSQILGAYERMEVNVQKILAENPSIEVAIDLHRDGVAENKRLVTDVGGKPTAQIMFFNGLSKIYKNGALMSIDSLPNTNLKANLATSFQMQLAANTLYPGFTRKIYLKAYRYSLHMLPKSMLIEVGAQTNTKEEALNSIEPLADILASVLLK